MAQPLAGKTSSIGQFTDEVVGEGKKVVSDLASEPRKILEQILGKAPPSGDASVETDPGQQAAQAAGAQQAKQHADQILKKQIEDQQKTAKLRLELLRRIQREDEASFDKRKREEEQKKLSEEEEKKQQTQQIIQLQHEQEKAKTLTASEEQLLGTKEKKAWGAG